MKSVSKIFLFAVVILISLSGCKSLQKTTATVNSVETVKSSEVKTGSVTIDTTKKSNNKIEIIKLEFYPQDSTHQVKSDSLGKTTPSVIIGNKKFPGNIKSATVTTITSNKEQKGTTAVDSSLNRNVDRKADIKTQTTTEPGKDPYRWRWIFGIMVVIGVAAYFIYNKFFKK